jgi:hypothetical protein
MMPMGEDLGTLLAGGILGYIIGRTPYQQWEGYINKYKERMGHLTYDRIVEPLIFYERIENSKKLYAEAIFAYLAGLPNASLPTTFRCLELCLKQHYEEVEKKKATLRAYELIEWSEKRLGDRKELAHGFRFLRNLIHEEKIVEEQDALEAIRHITKILNLVFPFSDAKLAGVCDFCKKPYNVTIPAAWCYLGNTVPVQCSNCMRSTNHFILPIHP